MTKTKEGLMDYDRDQRRTRGLRPKPKKDLWTMTETKEGLVDYD